MNTRTITNFLDKEYKDYSIYTIENRAISSVIDGLKIVHRKILFISNKIWGESLSGKPLKVYQLGGYVSAQSGYHHGDASLNAAIIGMCQTFKNNMPVLEGDGIIGSLRSTASGAPRYVGAKLSKNFKLIYKDFELLEYKEEEGMSIEPYFYLPIIPMILVNGSEGLAVGHASNILTRNVLEVTNSCIDYLMDKKIKPIPPTIHGFNGDWIKDPENPKRWIIRGKFNKMKLSSVNVIELPPNITYEEYEKYLDKLVESKDVSVKYRNSVIDYDDNCKDNINYTIKFDKQKFSKIDDDFISKILRIESYETENFTVLDESGKLKIFESDTDILKYFVDFRLSYYFKRKEFMIKKLERDKLILLNRGKFIKLILDNKLEVRNVSKDVIIKKLEDFKLDKIDDSYDYLLSMKIWSLTKELFEKLKQDFLDIKVEIETLQKVNPKDMYLDDLKELKKKLMK